MVNRGSQPRLSADVEELRGDRAKGSAGLDSLRGRRWDAAIDTCGYVPRVVGAAAELLRGAVQRYVFVSSISVYADFARGPDESSPVAELADPDSEDVPRDYGALKAACERVVTAAFGDHALNIRPGLIVGPFDPTGRFTYWALRLARGGDVLAPADPAAPVQFIDARDLARWSIDLVERGVGGTFNATGPAEPMRFDSLLERGAKSVGAKCRFRWVPGEFLLEQGVAPWSELPLWLPESEMGLSCTNIGRALGERLTLTEPERTFTDTLAWAQQQVAEHGPGTLGAAGLAPDREAAILGAWEARAAY